MAEYVDRVKLMAKWTSAENQQRLREMTGREVYGMAIRLLNDEPALVVSCKMEVYDE